MLTSHTFLLWTPVRSRRYAVALYVSILTCTTGGYASDVNPSTPFENITAMFMVCVGSVMWASFLAEAVRVLADSSKWRRHFQTQMDDLNYMMRWIACRAFASPFAHTLLDTPTPPLPPPSPPPLE